MSHFTVTVALSAEVEASAVALNKALEEALAPFDENTRVEPYVQDTRAEALASMDKYNYREEQRAKNPGVTDDELIISWQGVSSLDDQGNPLTTYNPRSEWDWWVVGGRWGGKWRFKSPVDYDYIRTQESTFGMADEVKHELATDCGRVGDIAAETIDSAWGYLDLDGNWVEKGKMGWWGLSDAEDSEEAEARWKKHYLDWIASLPKDAWIVNVDAHI